MSYASAQACESRALARENYFDIPENAVISKSEDYEVAFNPGGWLRISSKSNYRITKVFAHAFTCDHRFRGELGYGEDLLRGSIKEGDARKVSKVSRKCQCGNKSLRNQTMSNGQIEFIKNTLRICQEIENRFYSEQIKLGDVDPSGAMVAFQDDAHSENAELVFSDSSATTA